MWLCLLVPTFATGQAGLDIAVLKAGVGARPLGMGGAFTAVADNADAPYWNPAGLASIKDNEITTMQTKLSTDADHYYISYAKPALGGVVGFSWIQVGLGNITQTSFEVDTNNEVQNLGIFSYFSNAFMLSYGKELNEKLSFGLTAKYLTSDMFEIAGGQAYGYSITPGVLLKLAIRGSQLTIGAKIDELMNEQSWGTGTKEKAPPKARVGVSIKGAQGLLAGSLLAIDLARTLRSSYATEASFGYEWSSKDGLSLRTGLNEGAFSAGAGFSANKVILDYAYVSQSSLSRSNVHRISLSGKW